MSSITPVIMAGGSGTRLWPFSTKDDPKQYRKLVSDKTMLEETLLRVSGEGFAPPVIIASLRHRAHVEGQLPKGAAAIFEPFGRNTAPAAIMAALHVLEKEGEEGLVLLLPADHHIADAQGFKLAVERARMAAAEGYLVTLGIAPSAPETGYGYIKAAAPIGEGVYHVERFVEKPDRQTAEQYIAEGGYSWNAGIFLYRAGDLLRESAIHAPGILNASEAAFKDAAREGASRLLREESFGEVESDSIDYAIMEKTERAAVVSPVAIGWSDIGSWSAVKAFSRPGADEDAAVLLACPGTVVKAEPGAPFVAAVGLENYIVVATENSVLILPENQSQEVKTIVERLKARGRDDLL
ncbi:MAG: sugar phosphate nucleotidyltransferase [Parvularcula sp.]|jgi:mannose-1-phosphate guanylyltransferase/mannose-6-phosphate isomerase|nr:sugar phosphate nucleotidyltransferase [Parvularcula sp.]